MTHLASRAALPSLFLTLALAWSSPARAQPETLEVSFDLQEYTQDGLQCFGRNGVNWDGAPSGRTNYVQIMVVWLETDGGAYVTTLYRWGRSYIYNLEQWAQASDFALDGITESTPTSDPTATPDPTIAAQVYRAYTTGAQDISWLPDGDYQIRIETTICELADEWRSGGDSYESVYASFPFTKGRSNQDGVGLGSTAPFDSVTISYDVPADTPPGSWAGADQFLYPSVTPAESSTTLAAVVDDDAGTPTIQWSQVSSLPAGRTATINSPSQASTTVDFTAAGIYTFEVSADDGVNAASTDRVAVYVNTHVIPAADDAEVNTPWNNDVAMGIIDGAPPHGPWVFAWGLAGGNHSRGYFGFDVGAVASGTVEWAQLRLTKGEWEADTSQYHDVYILTDAQDDWNGAGDSSTDWEATITHNNQPVTDGDSANIGGLSGDQLIGSFQHDTCLHRHAPANPAGTPGPASECPGWAVVDLDLTPITTHDTNGYWSFFIENRGDYGMGIGSRENVIDSNVIVVEQWPDDSGSGGSGGSGGVGGSGDGGAGGDGGGGDPAGGCSCSGGSDPLSVGAILGIVLMLGLRSVRRARRQR